MSKELKNIEEIFRKSFTGYKIPPSGGIWKKIVRKLIYREFFFYNLSRFNIFYLGGILAIVFGGLILFNRDKDTVENRELKIQNIKLPDVVENPADISETLYDQVNHHAKEKGTPAKRIPGTEIKDDRYSRTNTAKEGGKNKKTKVDIVKKTNPVPDNKPEDKINEKNLFTTVSGKLKKDNVLLPVAYYYTRIKSGCAPLKIQFENRSENTKTYDWHFGDGGSSTEKDPSYIFDEPGEYIVALIASSLTGKDIVQDTIRVFANPEASFEIFPADVLIPENPVSFHNYSQNAIRYRWDFGDGSVSDNIEPMHYYVNNGEYNIKLVVWSEMGCMDSLIIKNAFENSLYEISFPNAFQPNPNGPSNGYYTEGLTTNEVFHPLYKGVVEYQLKIFNRFGSLIFESDDVNIGWDGYINDRLAKHDVYIWKVRGHFSNGQTFVKFGNVTLIWK